ncbi:TNF receptor-associated factor 3-like, partial [Paramuricea clavata]
VFPDVFTKRELNGLCLHCTNQDCLWYGTYEALEGHSTVCEHALINCIHSQCKMKFQRSHQGEHLKIECEYRNVKCDFCGQDVTFALMKEHIGTSCEGAPLTCKYCKEDVLRKDIENHERRDCDEVPATCEFQAVGCNHDKKKITMMLLDQGNGDHMIDAFHSDSQSSSFQRSKSDMNIASGSPLFMPLDSLNNRQYIKDD